MLAARSPLMLSILRIVAALCFMEHGCQKLLGFPSAPAAGMPHPFAFLWFAGVIELVGGFLVTIGFQTRLAAFILSGEMAVGYFTDHATKSFFPALNGGDAAVLYCFVFLYLVFAGPGPLAVDKR